jgi:hypothetical protein
MQRDKPARAGYENFGGGWVEAHEISYNDRKTK